MIKLCKRAIPHLVLASLLISPLAVIGCAAHAEYRTYDPDDGTYHYWNNGENTYYMQWETETHRHHRDYRKRNQNEQRQYWQWRQTHGDRNQGDHNGDNHDHGNH
ncbi:MAG TPA: hypothetical protein VNK23_09160 [Candidatus Dormibacteraeota bacterium]|nr:hypothetical protein [Candidatus Dormibacteraeota bacterium]